MANWMVTLLHKFRDRPPETRPDDERVELEKLQRALIRLHILDVRADIIARRSGKTHQ